MSFGQIVGAIAVFYFMLEVLTLVFVEWFSPEEDVDICRYFDKQKYSYNPDSYGNHEFKIKENQASIFEVQESNENQGPPGIKT